MIKSKERITEFGEVFTSEREVKAMLDLVYDEALRIDSRFLEPACGNGNFLIEVLRRKLGKVRERYSRNHADYEKNIIIAVSSVYGIDILHDNIAECIARLASFAFNEYSKVTKNDNQKFRRTVDFIFSKNILHGDATSLTLPDSDKPIIFSEWSFIGNNKVKRTEFTLANLIAYQPFDGDSLFSDLGEEAFIPQPLKTYELCHYLEVNNE